MGLFGNLFGGNINELMQEASQAEGSVVIDVRSPAEFAQGRIAGAINIPVDRIDAVPNHISNKETPLYLYCASGARSASACRFLQGAGYTNVTNMGGISGWRGDIERG